MKIPVIYKLARHAWLTLPVTFRERLRMSAVVNRLVHGATTSLAGITRDEDVYDEEYFHMVERTTGQSATVIVYSIVQDLHPKRLIDVGCGTGVLLERFRGFGVEVMGLENNEVALRMCKERSLNVLRFDIEHDPLISLAGADVAVSFEVGNLIAETSADRYVELMCGVSKAIVFSAGGPGQGGVHVMNEQPQEYWADKFQARGFALNEELSTKWRLHWKANNTAAWFFNNILVFQRGE